ncbi:MAG: acetyl-CoA carboxylase biotin carboxyl carrier protein [Candidatus Eisenbacteria bacterium]
MPSKRKAAAKPARPVKTSHLPADNSAGELPGLVPLAEVRRLIRLVQHTGIGELEVSSGGRTVRISAFAGGTPRVAMHASPEGYGPGAPMPAGGNAGTEPKPAESAQPDRSVAITSPMVGTFYLAPAPDADPYVEVGDMVEVGQTVCIIEAMKLMNEIEAEARGRVVQIMVENSHPVEFGQKLFLIEPA